MKMSAQVVRLSAAAVALAATLSVAPAAHAASLPSPLVDAWRRLVRLVGEEGLGVDPNGFKGRLVTTGTAGTTSSASAPRTTAAAAHGRPR